MKISMLILVTTLMLNGCATDEAQLFRNESSVATAAFGELKLLLKNEKQFNEMSDDAQKLYITRLYDFKLIQLLSSNGKFSSDQLVDIIEKRGSSKLKDGILSDASFSEIQKKDMITEIDKSGYGGKGKPILLPAGAKVSAVVNNNVANIVIDGVLPREFHYYSYSGVRNLGPGTNYKINLREGARFSFIFVGDDNQDHIVLLTPEMKFSKHIDFLGSNIDIDCSYNNECCFIVK